MIPIGELPEEHVLEVAERYLAAKASSAGDHGDKLAKKWRMQTRFWALRPSLFHEPVDLRGAEGLDWIIAGGESGSSFRPADPDWFRRLRDQCAAAGRAFLFKQWGGANQSEIKALGRALDGVVHDGYPVPRRVEAV